MTADNTSHQASTNSSIRGEATTKPENIETTTTIAAPSNYEPRLVAFLDILGWRDLIDKSQKDPAQIQKMGSALTYLRLSSEMRPAMEEQAKTMLTARGEKYMPSPDDLQFAQFSDCIVISATATGWGRFTLQHEVFGINKNLFYLGGLLVGGAITTGAMYHKGQVAFGPALTAVYDLERNFSIHPRVILDHELEQPFLNDSRISVDGKPAGRFKWIRQAPDGFYFLDFLQPLAAISEDILGIEMPRDFSGLNFARKAIMEGLRDHRGKPRAWEKYRWVAEYFNEVVAEYPDANIPPIAYK